MKALPSVSIRNASSGHRSTQMPHPIHFSLLIALIIFYTPFDLFYVLDFIILYARCEIYFFPPCAQDFLWRVWYTGGMEFL